VAASLVPMWLLLQPRGHLGGYFLLVALAGGALGILFGGHPVRYPAFISWSTARGETLFPLLFITIACGACSGFHALVASGTTSRQLRRETDARPIGYGAMLMEGMVAVVSLCCVMMLAPAAIGPQPKPNYIYAAGMGQFLKVAFVPEAFAVSFALLAFTTFVYDTLDVSMRLARYILQEFTGWHGRLGRWTATLASAAVPLFFVLQRTVDAAGRPLPVWRAFWPLFGACNQLLAALALVGITVWLIQAYRARWAWLVTGLPTLWMYTMSTWALLGFIRAGFFPGGRPVLPHDAVPWAALVLVLLAVLILVEAIRGFTVRPAPASA